MLIIAEKEYDLGEVKFGSISEKEILVQNTSGVPITMNSIGTSCSCTSGSMKTNPIPANGTSTAVIRFNSNKVGKGQHTKSFTMSWNMNGRNYSQKVMFKAHVK